MLNVNLLATCFQTKGPIYPANYSQLVSSIVTSDGASLLGCIINGSQVQVKVVLEILCCSINEGH